MAIDNQLVSDLRREYVANGLSQTDLAADPLTQFRYWFEEALSAHPDDATSMTLATADAQGRPAARIVLLKHFDEQGFCWFTDFRSEKGQHLAENPYAEILFYWYGLERQVRIRGRVEKTEYSFGESYFKKRPHGSQLSAAISHQSAPVDSRETLEKAVVELDQAHPDGVLTCPQTWGGFRMIPEQFEFWQGRESRLHDRFRYTSEADGWTIQRLQP